VGLYHSGNRPESGSSLVELWWACTTVAKGLKVAEVCGDLVGLYHCRKRPESGRGLWRVGRPVPQW
jgi:hypothetical protein